MGEENVSAPAEEHIADEMSLHDNEASSSSVNQSCDKCQLLELENRRLKQKVIYVNMQYAVCILNRDLFYIR